MSELAQVMTEIEESTGEQADSSDTPGKCWLGQGHLKKWTGHSKLILPNSKPHKISSSKF